MQLGRNAVLAAGFPDNVPGTSIDRQCGSSQQAIHFAAQGVMAGAYDVVIAAGVESMTRVPMGASLIAGQSPFGPRMHERYPDLVPQGISAELIAEKWGLSPRGASTRSRSSRTGAPARATDEGRFEHEIVPVPVTTDDGTELMTRDEGIRPDSSLERLADAQAGVQTRRRCDHGRQLVADHRRRRRGADHERGGGRPPRAHAARAVPLVRARGRRPDPHAHRADPGDREGARARGLTLDDMDLIEINEAFASVVLAWEQELHPDMSKVNVNGGAIALGHPLGGSGARIAATLLHELERTGGRYGLQTMCEGGGMANAMIMERCVTRCST